MILIRDPDHIAQIANPHLQDFLRQRLSALADHGFYTPDLHGYMIIVEPGDNADDTVERTLILSFVLVVCHYSLGVGEFGL